MGNMLNGKSTLALVMELIYQQEARRWPSIVNPEELQVGEILEILERRAGLSFSRDVERCLAWFTSSSSPLADRDKVRINRLMALKNGDREFSEVFGEMLAEMKGKDSDGPT
jgi:hypothetical protein